MKVTEKGRKVSHIAVQVFNITISIHAQHQLGVGSLKLFVKMSICDGLTNGCPVLRNRYVISVFEY